MKNARLASEELNLVYMCAGDTIYLLLDTGTVSNLVPEESRSIVQDIRNERTAMIGLGDARPMASEIGGAGVFGRSRVVPLSSSRSSQVPMRTFQLCAARLFPHF